ncbi:P-loop containing nucleoside triphosphate hydrolase protein [Aspergillus aurantiobrunneus]
MSSCSTPKQTKRTGSHICFGMLRDIQIPIDPVQDPQCILFGEILRQTKVFASLELSTTERPTWTGVIPISELQQKMIIAAETVPKLASKVTCMMSILVSEPRPIGKTLAKELARHHLFLQHPDAKPDDLEYDNPQYLSLVGVPCLDLDEINDISAVLGNLPQQAFHKEVEIDQCICTELKCHQRTAVNFIVSREQAQSENKNKLWRLERGNTGERVYKHIITGSESLGATDIRGGILADDMGLGKTLSMIASIVASLPCEQTVRIDDDKSDINVAKQCLIPVTSTLIIVPSLHVIPGALKHYKYHGPGRSIPLDPPTSDHIKAGVSVLNRNHWHRLILDEAHVIRNSSTKQFNAILSLSATIRWCMTGTKTNYRKPKLLLAAISLRREMSTVFPAPGVTSISHRLSLSDNELRAYEALIQACERQVKAAANTSSKRKESRTMLTAMLRWSMFCNTGLRSQFIGGKDACLTPEEVVTMLQQGGKNMCSEDILSFCRHLECEECAHPPSGLSTGENPRGPQISLTLTPGDPMEDVRTTTEQGSGPPIDVYPSKLLTLLADIEEHYSEDKIIAFTFWRQSLDLIGQMFNEKGIVFCRVDGMMAPIERQAALEEFQRNSAVRVFLMTIGTGAMGLNNLSVASQIHILEPQWNPSVESQAIARALRWGQGKKVFVIRYIVKGAVEEDIAKGQLRKMELSSTGSELQESQYTHSNLCVS